MRRGEAKRAQLRRRRFTAGLGLLVVVLVVLVVLLAGGGEGTPRTPAHASQPLRGSTAGSRAGVQVSGARTGTLPTAVQDAAATAVGPARFLLMGGIDRTEASVADIVGATPTGASQIGVLSTALHDASASFVDGAAYLFGGGVVSSFPQITRVEASGTHRPAGRLPTPASDVATAVVGATVYVVGGYTGLTPLRTILEWRPGETARVVATLPHPLRYAAVASLDGTLVIAGGTSGEVATRDIYRFDPGTDTLTLLGRLPNPLTHAAAASAGHTVLVFGGRSTSATSQTRRILAIEPDGRVHTAGELPLALSDLAAVSLGRRVVLAGGRDRAGRPQDAILTMTTSGI